MSSNMWDFLSNTYPLQNETSFWQSDIWESILTKTHQANIIWLSLWEKRWIFERRKIFGNMTALYALGTTEDAEFPLSHILHELRKHITPHDLFVQIEPLRTSHASTKTKQNAPFRRFLEPTTAIIRLWQFTEETLLQSFGEKWRYNTRLAERRWIKTQWVRGDDVSMFSLPWKSSHHTITYTELFFELLQETTQRDHFAHNSLSYYQHFIRTLEEYQAGWLLIATRWTTVHCAGIFVYYKDAAIYYYGASSSNPEIRRDKWTHLLQWNAMQEALRRKCHIYDFLWISSSPWDKLAGVTQFKMQFSPEKISLPHESVIVLRPFLLKICTTLRTIRKISRQIFIHHT